MLFVLNCESQHYGMLSRTANPSAMERCLYWTVNPWNVVWTVNPSCMESCLELWIPALWNIVSLDLWIPALWNVVCLEVWILALWYVVYLELWIPALWNVVRHELWIPALWYIVCLELWIPAPWNVVLNCESQPRCNHLWLTGLKASSSSKSEIYWCFDNVSFTMSLTLEDDWVLSIT